MTTKTIDLRSDTVTKPTEDMRKVMANAEVGDDVYGEDQSINAFEQVIADFLGKEAALFTPSGTMANQIAINLHTLPGDTIICEQDSHVYLYEAGAAAALSGVQFSQIPWQELWSNEAIDHACKPNDMHAPTSTLLVVENTHNRGGGRPTTSENCQRIVEKARRLNLSTHCDGARIWNAAAAFNESETDLVKGFDTVACCFSKGLGAPVGSVLAGPRDLIERGRKVRKRFGGAMRQAGILAAAAQHAFEKHRPLLKDDHQRCSELISFIKDIDRFPLQVPETPTNMLYFYADPKSYPTLTEHFRNRQILFSGFGNGWYRIVFHLQVNDDDLSRVKQAFNEIS